MIGEEAISESYGDAARRPTVVAEAFSLAVKFQQLASLSKLNREKNCLILPMTSFQEILYSAMACYHTDQWIA